MRAWLKRFFYPPVFPDAEKTRHANALVACLVVFIVATICGYALVPFITAPWLPSAIVLTLVLACLLGVFWLTVRGNVTAASFLLPLVLWCEVVSLGFFTGGILGVSFPFFTLVVLLSALLIGAKGDAFFIPLSVTAALLLYTFGRRGLLPASFLRMPWRFWSPR